MVTVTTNSTSNTQNILKFIKQWSNISFLDCLSQSPLCRWSGLRSDLFTWKSLSQCRSARLSHANIAIHHNDTSHHNTQCTFYMLQQKSTARMSMLRFFLNCRKCNKCLIGRKECGFHIPEFVFAEGCCFTHKIGFLFHRSVVNESSLEVFLHLVLTI